MTIGRNRTHTYNNQDHSMVMAMLAVRNLLGAQHDLWNLNDKDVYLEQICAVRNPPLTCGSFRRPSRSCPVPAS